ncbi:dCTP deaminase [Dactylosporangium salmoneum]|uniref:dCTP deaminase n=2 Tax=Dactylosporangium salmoneum TaxID=53361 RepID=A0ABP5T6U5_9ACTN
MLSDVSIRKLLAGGLIEPMPHDWQIQPASVDLLLGEMATPTVGTSPWLLQPGEFRLASTLELVTVPADVVAMVSGKSSLARAGLTVEQAGWIDPGFSGQITLELFNATRHPIRLEPEQPICQIAFMRLDQRAARPYGTRGLRSKYQGQTGPTPARPGNFAQDGRGG